jgi:hypothetical protein
MTKTIAVPHNWWPRPYQVPLWNALLFEQKKRAIYIWHRRAGKDILALNRLITAMVLEQVGTYWHVFPSYSQGRKAIWQETTIEGRKYIDYFPKELIKSKNDKDLKIELINGSVYQIVGSDNPDSLRGAGIKGAVFSEYSEQDSLAWDIIRPMLLATSGFAMFNFTPKGQNHAYELYKMAENNRKTWHCEILDAEKTGVFTKEQLDQVKKETLDSGKTLDFFNQEFYCSFTNPVEGAYYSSFFKDLEEKKQIGAFTHEPSLSVSTHWDLGVGDSTAIWFAQFVRNEIRIIDYIENNNVGLDWYIREVKNKAYIYEAHFAPHDISVREFSNGKSRYETAIELGLLFSITPNLSIEDGINAARAILHKCYFNEEKTRPGVLALKNYKKEFDRQANCFKLKPKHDWTSHAADAFRYLAVNYKIATKNDRPDYVIDNTVNNH